MKEDIKREAMHEKLTQLMKDLDVYNCAECQNCESYKYGLDCDDDCFCGKVADYLIAADVVERKRGEWVDTGFENSTGKIYVCSACNKTNNPNKKDVELGRTKEKPDFCPNCGADMRGGVQT